MLWNLVDVLAVLVAFGLILMLGPNVIGLSKWKKRLLDRKLDEPKP